MLVHLRMNVPPELVDDVRKVLDDPRVTHLAHLPGASLSPAGDIFEADVAREAASDILDLLDVCRLEERGGITVQEIAGSLSEDAARAGEAAIGSPDDGVVWPMVAATAEAQASPSFSYFAFLTLGCALAAIAVITDSPVLIVGAMVVSPDFAPVAAMNVGMVMRRWRLVGKAAQLLGLSFAVAIAIVTILALVGRFAGVITPSELTDPRPLTGFIWHPDLWSFIVALLAGAAGTLSMTSGKSSALVGVFISVTTIPAAGNLALGLALWSPDEIGGSALQLVVNIAGMMVAGFLTLLLQHTVWTKIMPRRKRRAANPKISEQSASSAHDSDV